MPGCPWFVGPSGRRPRASHATIRGIHGRNPWQRRVFVVSREWLWRWIALRAKRQANITCRDHSVNVALVDGDLAATARGGKVCARALDRQVPLAHPSEGARPRTSDDRGWLSTGRPNEREEASQCAGGRRRSCCSGSLGASADQPPHPLEHLFVRGMRAHRGRQRRHVPREPLRPAKLWEVKSRESVRSCWSPVPPLEVLTRAGRMLACEKERRRDT